MKKIILLMALLCCIGKAHAQISAVNQSAGTLSVGIPLYTLQEGQIAVPIGLSYQGSGVAVEAAASSVGINWQLNAGGAIVRSVRGKPDESITDIDVNHFAAYLIDRYPLDEKYAFAKDFEPDIFTVVLGGANVRFTLKKETINGLPKFTVLLLDKGADLKIEVISDNTSNYPPGLLVPSGGAINTFDNLILKEGNAVTGLSSFVVTTADGMKYYFGTSINEREYVLSKNAWETPAAKLSAYSNQIMASICPYSWYLSKVVYPKTPNIGLYQQVTFNYTRSIQPLVSLVHDKEYTLENAPCASLPKTALSTDAFIYKCDLTNITSDNYDITFNSNTIAEPKNIASIIPDYVAGSFANKTRQDLAVPGFADNIFLMRLGASGTIPEPLVSPFKTTERTKALNNIVIKDKTTQQKIGYYLHHDYFQEYSVSSTNSNNYTFYQSGRLNLKGIYTIKFDALDSTSLMPQSYSFFYNGKTLPVNTSLARDHWGYYNGADANAQYQRLYVSQSACGNPNLNPSLDFAKIGSLYMTKLPMGGVEYYEYELHSSNNYVNQDLTKNIGGLRAKSIRRFDPLSKTDLTTSYNYNLDHSTLSSGYMPICPFYTIQSVDSSASAVTVTSYIVPSIYATLFTRFINGTYVTYSTVKEETTGIKQGQVLSNGYTVYEFITNSLGGSPICINSLRLNKLSSKLPEIDYLRGYPKSVKYYDPASNITQQITYNYVLDDIGEVSKGGVFLYPYTIDPGQGIIPLAIAQPIQTASQIAGYASYIKPIAATQIGAIAIATIQILSFIITIVNLITSNYSDSYNIYPYYLRPYQIRPTTVVSATYDKVSNQRIETTTAYYYESQNHHQVTKTQTYRSDGLALGQTPNPILSEQNVKYSADYAVPDNASDAVGLGILGLKKRNMLVPIESISKRKGRVVGGQIIEYYGDAGKEGLVKSVHALELAQTLPSFTMSDYAASSFSKDANYRKQSDILAYNERGLPSSSKSVNENGTTNFTFGVNGYFPTEVSYTSGSKTIVKKSEYALPMFGTSKVTNADNTTMSYVYDDLGRIKAIKDQNGFLVKSYNYNNVLPPIPSQDIGLELYALPPLLVKTGTKMTTFTEGAVIKLSDIPVFSPDPTLLNIKAIPTAAYDYFELTLSGSMNRANVSTSVDTWLADTKATLFRLATGTYKLDAKAYSKGVLVSRKQLNFSVIN